MFFRVFDQLRASQVPFPPGSDDLDVGLAGVVAEFEAYLVVALARGPVGNGVGPGFQRDLDLALGDQGAGDGGAEEVGPFMGVGAEHGKHIVPREFFAEILDMDLLDAQHLGLFAGGLQLYALTRSAVKVTTSQPYASRNHFRITEVSNPPE